MRELGCCRNSSDPILCVHPLPSLSGSCDQHSGHKEWEHCSTHQVRGCLGRDGGGGVSYRQLAAKDKRDKSQSLIWHTHTHTHTRDICQMSTVTISPGHLHTHDHTFICTFSTDFSYFTMHMGVN